ncbi:MAG: HIT domain-containing protein [Acidobacteriota bacterium]
MDQLFTPWRLDYLLSPHNEDGCLFCNALESRNDQEKLILHRGPHCFIILNLYPYNNGHLMVLFNRHLSRLASATTEEQDEMMRSIVLAERLLQEAYEPDGLNIGMNLGHAAGAGVAGHLHVHLVPRWEADTNFAAVLAGTRIIPETPQASYTRLRPLFERDAPELSRA